MKIKEIEITKLNPAEYNPRKDLTPKDTEYQQLKKSIETFGYVEPIVVNEKTGNVISGHQRLKVIQDLNRKRVKVVCVDLDSENEKALNIAMNKISGEWDMPKLSDLLSELKLSNFDATITGFTQDEIDNLFEIYEPTNPDDQSILDQRSKTECPKCGAIF